MSHSSKIFEEAPIKVQNKNGFDLSHLNCGSSKCGQLVPVLCKLLPPNSDFTLGVALDVSLPPLATSFFGRIDAIVEGFVVPCSVLYGGWKQFISNNQSTMIAQNGVKYELPYFSLKDAITAFGTDDEGEDFDPIYNTLYATNDNIGEYLGLRSTASDTYDVEDIKINLLPFLAYHLIWNTYYRNKNVTKTIFAVNSNPSPVDPTDSTYKNVSYIWHSYYVLGGTGNYGGYFGLVENLEGVMTTDSIYFPDGISIFSTRQRNYARDYFTAAQLSPQQGNPSALQFSVDASGDGSFTIASLRAANSLQKFLETNNLSGDYSDMMRNRWGTRPIDADFDEPYYLGRCVVPVYQKSVYQQNITDPDLANTDNPYTSKGLMGAKAASGSFVGQGSITSKFHNTTWAYVMCLFSLVPHAMYGQGISRELTMLNLGDFPAPELQSVGHEEIYSYEVATDFSNVSFAETFGYIPRYSRFKYIDDQIHGELRPDKSLAAFVLQRNLDPTGGDVGIHLTTDFLEIPQDALDGVLSVETSTMNLSCWWEIFFEFKVSMPLATFCIPTLGDLQDSHYQKTTIGGSRL